MKLSEILWLFLSHCLWGSERMLENAPVGLICLIQSLLSCSVPGREWAWWGELTLSSDGVKAKWPVQTVATISLDRHL